MSETAAPNQSGSLVHRCRAVVAATVGTTIEWYDFFIHLNAAAWFGHYGDRVGRKKALVATLLLMGASTVLIGFLPTYAAIGVVAPILLVVLRIAQGLGVGGEWAGSVLLAMEWGKQDRRGLFASWPQFGVPLGLLLSTGAMSVMSAVSGPDFLTWGWRVPFIASIVLIGIGLWVRMRVLQSPDFERVKASDTITRLPVVEAFKRYPRAIIASALVRMSEQAPFYLFVTFALTHGTQQLELPRGQLLNATMVAAAVGLVSIPLFGWLSDRLGRRVVYGAGIVLTALFAFPYFALLDTKIGWLVLLAIVLSLIVHDIQYGPQAALIAESFEPEVRYSAAGLGYQLASVIAGGPAPLIAAAILASTGSSFWISVYILACCVISAFALWLLPKRPTPAEQEREPVRASAG